MNMEAVRCKQVRALARQHAITAMASTSAALEVGYFYLDNEGRYISAMLANFFDQHQVIWYQYRIRGKENKRVAMYAPFEVTFDEENEPGLRVAYISEQGHQQYVHFGLREKVWFDFIQVNQGIVGVDEYLPQIAGIPDFAAGEVTHCFALREDLLANGADNPVI